MMASRRSVLQAQRAARALHSARCVVGSTSASASLWPPVPSSRPAQQQQMARQFCLSAARLRASPVEGHSYAAPPPSSAEGRARNGDESPSSSSTSNAGAEMPIVRVDAKNGKVGVTWSSGIESQYHHIWLRDHCRCAECYHPQTKQRQLDTFSIPTDVRPFNVEATTEGLLVYWPSQAAEREGTGTGSQAIAQEALSSTAEPSAMTQNDVHASLYPWSWLYANSYAPSLSLGASSFGRNANTEMIMWGSGIAQQPPMVTFDEVMDTQNERGVAKWLNKVAQFGFCFVSNVPATPEETERLVRRIAFIRETHYGGFWDFTSDLSHGDTAYTNLPLGAHTDTTYFTDPAGLQLFHLLSHTESVKDQTPARGGESLLVDGFFAANILREVHPEAYKVLSTTNVSTHSAGDDATLIRPLQSGGYPILEHDSQTGELIRVRYNNDDRSVLRLRDESVLPFYDALRKWHAILSHVDSEYWCQLTPGTAMIFDNHRVLHGRSAFTGNRRLCGAYVNHDDYRSRLAVLQKQYPNVDSPASARRAATTASSAGATAASSNGTASSASKTDVPSTAKQVARRGVWDDGL